MRKSHFYGENFNFTDNSGAKYENPIFITELPEFSLDLYIPAKLFFFASAHAVIEW